MLGKTGVEGGKVIVLARDSRAGCRPSVEDFSIDPFCRIDASLDHRDLSVEGVADVGAGLGAAPLVKIGYGVVVAVGDVVLHPVALEHTTGVFFVIIFFQGIFYCRNAAQQ